MKKQKNNKIYLEFTPEIREWLKMKAEEQGIEVQEVINQLISEQMDRENFKFKDKDNKYKIFIEEYLKIIRKF